ncbi:MAG: SH3 domain-containing protein [Faecalibacterium sp.]|nr:SH3 domain-containing protein [Ruminococcus sp.]MCM1392622.1 SH3 domain-containing protein [Ruminococcus sp.]MCM1486071.1 SH3 domain-containing protein [Faecalibacterium sp.]
MKCTNCGHELEPGSGFCDNCGTIMSLDNEIDEVTENDSIDIFSGSEPVDNEPEFSNIADGYEHAMELEIDETEQVVESETVSDEEALAGVSYSDYDDSAEHGKETEEHEHDFDGHEEADSDEHEHDDHDEAEEDVDNPFDAAEADYEETEDADESEEDGEDDDLDDMYVTSKKKGKGGAVIAVMLVFLIVVVAVGANVVKNNLPSKPSTSANANASETSDEDETSKTQTATTDVEEPTDEETTDETTEVTEEDTTDETTEESNALPVDVTEPSTTQKETTVSTTKATTQPSTTVPATRPNTTVQSTTKAPVTTSPKTTARPTTIKPSTTVQKTTEKTTAKPTTTSPSTTKDPYGFNFVEVEKPKQYVTDNYKVYVTTNALALRSEPSTASERIVYLPIGTSCTVYGAKQNGFIYVRSDRYGVYGWVSTDYTSKTRPESTSTTVVPNLVEPDEKYEKASVKHVNDADGLRLRKGPGTSYDIITRIDNGFPVKVIGYSTTVSGWVYVLDTIHGIYGWVSSAYIK